MLPFSRTMPDISLTDEQHERLEAVRRDVEAAFVDTYGQTHLEDAIQYLLDTYTPPDERGQVGAYGRFGTADYATLQRIASDVPEVPGSGIEADEMRGKLLAELGAAELADRVAKLDGDQAQPTSGEGTTPRSDRDPESTGTDPEGSGTDESAVASSGETESGEEGDGLLSMPNRLLQEHEGKWQDSDSSDEPYVVELPDGTTEMARTKDDVRRLLFQYY